MRSAIHLGFQASRSRLVGAPRTAGLARLSASSARESGGGSRGYPGGLTGGGLVAAGALLAAGGLAGLASEPTACEDGSAAKGRLAQVMDRIQSLERNVLAVIRGSGAGGGRGAGGVDVVLGAQWGDEGKGKLVDMLSGKYDVCARVAGGSNAGHTIVVDGVKYKFHLVPSGILNQQTTCVVGNGVVVHVPSLLAELAELKKQGIDYSGRLLLSDRAHMVFDFHQEIDGIRELARGRNKIGTTKKGIGPAYADKIARHNVRLGDLRFFDTFEANLRRLAENLKLQYPTLKVDVDAQVAYYKSVRDEILPMITDTIEYTHQRLDEDAKLLVEGANATMLDIDFGTYPYVTSSNPSIGSVCTGLGVGPTNIEGIYGTVKAYCTRVGDGPFPTELHDATGDYLRKEGGEFGTTTGRPRRCGWLDVPQMRFSKAVNGFTALNLTKLDVLTGMDEIKIGVGYRYKGERIHCMPSNLQVLQDVEVEYESLPSWKEDISQCRTFDDLPLNAKNYVLRVEELIGCYVRWIGVGAGRDATIDRGARD